MARNSAGGAVLPRIATEAAAVREPERVRQDIATGRAVAAPVL